MDVRSIHEIFFWGGENVVNLNFARTLAESGRGGLPAEGGRVSSTPHKIGTLLFLGSNPDASGSGMPHLFLSLKSLHLGFCQRGAKVLRSTQFSTQLF